jgi:long-chain acyl-CoA synthetase
MIIGQNLTSYNTSQPSKTAIIHNDSKISYEQFTENVSSIQHYLEKQNGLQQESCRIALKLGNEPAFLETFFAAVLLGYSCIPLDPKWTPKELEHVLNKSKPDLVITPELYNEMVNNRVQSIRQEASPLDIFYVGFTSGSTGNPKGFQRHHQSWIDSFNGCNEAFHLTSEEIYCAPGPLCHSLSLFAAIYAIHIGATLVLSPKFNAKPVVDSMNTHQVTAVFLVPTMLQAMSDINIQIPSVTKILSSGAKWLPSVKEKVKTQFPNSERFEFYGASETSFITYLDEKGNHEKPSSVGKSFPGVEVTVKDSEGKVLPPNTIGLLHVKSSMIFSGYIHHPREELQEITVGDLGYIDDQGYITLVGREKNMIISGGLNIYPEEIESHIKRIDVVEEVVVAGIEDEYWGEKVVAFIKWKQHGGLSDETIKEYCLDGLASYKCPKLFYSIGNIPYTSSGKVDRTELVKKYTSLVGE